MLKTIAFMLLTVSMFAACGAPCNETNEGISGWATCEEEVVKTPVYVKPPVTVVDAGTPDDAGTDQDAGF